MNPAHVHLIINHVPVVGLAFALALLAWGAVRSNQALIKAALVSLVALALVAIPVYLTGEPAEKAVKGLPGVGYGFIEQHDDAATAALVGVLVAGGAGLIGLWAYRARPVAAWFSSSMLLLCLIAAGLMAWTANLGGQIRHTEIRGPSQVPPSEVQEK